MIGKRYLLVVFLSLLTFQLFLPKPYKEGAWDWLYSRQETCIKDGGENFDPSDAGMIIYLLTGVEKTNPDLAREIMENPIQKK